MGALRWDDESVDQFFDFLRHYWWLVFPLSGMAGGWVRQWSKASERRHRRRLELYKLKNQAVQAEQASQAQVAALMAAHDAVNRRWLDYELDVGKLIDFPVMTDVREPLTVAFLRAKREADGLRPAKPEEITTAARLAEYRAAVHSFELAFDVAEREAKRIKDSNSRGPNASGWQRPGSCSTSPRTTRRHLPNGRPRTSAPGASWTVSSSCPRPRWLRWK